MAFTRKSAKDTARRVLADSANADIDLDLAETQVL